MPTIKQAAHDLSNYCWEPLEYAESLTRERTQIVEGRSYAEDRDHVREWNDITDAETQLAYLTEYLPGRVTIPTDQWLRLCQHIVAAYHKSVEMDRLAHRYDPTPVVKPEPWTRRFLHFVGL